jgi:hypothetical protein
MSDLPLSDDDLRALLELRSARMRGTPVPAERMTIAEHLGHFGLVRAQSMPRLFTGGVEITEKGLAELTARFLFCGVSDCDGILRRWAPRADSPPDPQLLSSHAADGTASYALICPKCDRTNVLTTRTEPRHRADYTVAEVRVAAEPGAGG